MMYKALGDKKDGSNFAPNVSILPTNTLLSYVAGSYFYGLNTKDSDIDLLIVTHPTNNDILFGKFPSSKGKHTYKVREIFDLANYSMMHFFNLIASGNINFIEKVLCAAPDDILYINSYLLDDHVIRLLESLARKSISSSSLYNLRGLCRNEMQYIDDGIYYSKSLLNYWRYIIEMETLIDTCDTSPTVLCKYPSIMNLEIYHNDLLVELYENHISMGNHPLNKGKALEITDILYKRYCAIDPQKFKTKTTEKEIQVYKDNLIYFVMSKIWGK